MYGAGEMSVLSPLLPIFSTLRLCLVSASLFNAALYKPAYQSSDYPFFENGTLTADLANDGYDDPIWLNRHCQSTNNDSPPWWMVDLRGLYRVEQIVITNRGDDKPSSERAKDYQIDVFTTDPRLSPNFPMASGQVCYTRTDPLGLGETFTQNCTTPIVGRFVRFIRYTQDLINLCEIKVMASFISYRENKFSRTKKSRLTTAPLITTTSTSSPTTCSQTCLERRDSDTCTAFNWVRTSNQCQMFRLDPRISVSLTADSDTDFYIQA